MSYINVPFNTDTDDLVSQGLDYLVQNLPGYVPREGHLDVALLEVIGRLLTELRLASSQVPLAIFRYLGKSLFGIAAIDAASAIATSTWTVQDTAGYAIPSGTLVAYQLASAQQAYFRTVDTITIAPGLTSTASGEVLIRSLNPGAAYNDIPPGTLQLVDALSYVTSVTAITPSAGGVNAETDPEYLDRLRQELQLLAPRPIIPNDFAVFARRIAGVDRSIAIDGYNPDNGTYENERMVTVAVADEQGNAVTAPTKAAVQAYLEANREANFIVNVIDPTYTTVNVAATVHALPGYDPVVVRQSCVTAIKAYLNPKNWDWSVQVLVNELEYVLRIQPGVRYVDAVTSPATNMVLPGVAALVEAGSVDIAVLT